MTATPYTINRPARPAAPRRKATEEQLGTDKARRAQLIEEAHGKEAAQHLQKIGAL